MGCAERADADARSLRLGQVERQVQYAALASLTRQLYRQTYDMHVTVKTD